MSSGLIAVHCGAGFHKEKSHPKYKRLCRQACRKAIQTLEEGGTALEAVRSAIIALENDPLTNAGLGANLTMDEKVELDASIMDGKSLIYGGCGAVQRVKNPITLAYNVCKTQSAGLPTGLIPPSLVVGEGADSYANKIGLEMVDNSELATARSVRKLNKCKKVVEKLDSVRLDTVGAVCIDNNGQVASGCSSGGLLLKCPGRVGQAALYASGTWADSFDSTNETSVAVSTTGCGEYLVRTSLAREIACDLKSSTSPIQSLHTCLTDKFIKSRYLQHVGQKLAGALVLHVTKDGEGSLLWGHTSETMSIGYMQTGKKPKALISRLPDELIPGTSINISGIDFLFNRCNNINT